MALLRSADVSDAHEGKACVVLCSPMPLRHFGKRTCFAGRVATVKCFEDNSLVKAAADGKGHGRVLVVDGGGSLRRSLVGGNVAAAAAENGWAGLVVFGCVRDSHELADTDIGVMALGTCPQRTDKRNEGQRDVLVEVGGCRIAPGDLLVADADGVVVLRARHVAGSLAARFPLARL